MLKGIKMVFIMSSFMFLVIGCGKPRKPAVVIDNLRIYPDEFEAEFRESAYGYQDTEVSRRRFLEVFVERKAMLAEAIRLGLDKDPQFLENIQDFWEQSLLKLLLDRKTKELSTELRISEEEIKDYYQSHLSQYKDKDLSSVRDEIKIIIFKKKQKDALRKWIKSLKRRLRIEIDYKQLKLGEEAR